MVSPVSAVKPEDEATYLEFPVWPHFELVAVVHKSQTEVEGRADSRSVKVDGPPVLLGPLHAPTERLRPNTSSLVPRQRREDV